MKKNDRPRIRHISFFTLIVLLLAYSVQAQLRLPGYYGNQMILQRDQIICITGWASPGQEVKLRLKAKQYQTQAAGDSSWRIKIPASTAGGPYQLHITSGKQNLSLTDIYFGDIWFCSGQSNMNFRMRSIKNHQAELADADYPMIRQFDVPHLASVVPNKDIAKSAWTPCSAETMDNFSAVALQFAKNIYKQYKVPIGLIHSSWGGSPIETFLSAEALRPFAQARQKISVLSPTFIADTRAANLKSQATWELNFYQASAFISPEKKLRREPDFFDSRDWKAIKVPGFLEDQGFQTAKGIAWYKRQFSLDTMPQPDSMTLDLGRINFASITFINGKFAGIQLNPYYNASFRLPTTMLKTGSNEIMVCAFNDAAKTGFRPISKPMLHYGNTEISLSGIWKFRQGKTFDHADALGKVSSPDFENSYPTLAYNAMIHPFFNYQLKGILWYQGEANATKASCTQYQKMLQNLITSWRKAWNDAQLPFLIVQIANYGEITQQPVASPWALIQQAQSQTSNTVNNCGIVITNDVGNPIDVHPTDKQTVGYRLARVARKMVYKETALIASGPEFQSLSIHDNMVTVHFKNDESGLTTSDGQQPRGFSIAGADLKFYRAEARIAGNTLQLSAVEVPSPKFVRYAFESSPPQVNFYNTAGFPGIPFRTDREKIIP